MGDVCGITTLNFLRDFQDVMILGDVTRIPVSLRSHQDRVDRHSGPGWEPVELNVTGDLGLPNPILSELSEWTRRWTNLDEV